MPVRINRAGKFRVWVAASHRNDDFGLRDAGNGAMRPFRGATCENDQGCEQRYCAFHNGAILPSDSLMGLAAPNA